MIQSMQLSDEKLITDYLRGEEKSLEILIRRYLKPIYSFACRYTGNAAAAEDITQETFLKAWRNLKNFDCQKSFKTWIFSIAKNASIDFLRKKKMLTFSDFEKDEEGNPLLDSLADKSPLPNELTERADLAQILSSALEKLSSKYRLVLFMRYNDHFSFREIAEALDESIHTIKSRHRRALIILRKILAESL